ncbi:crossover junction endodeoxyribonuclease RuvC [Thermoactinomyces sp. DSM 45891]|nr:crossover junction endodeoxyribonuclease RuvC [Thermoactinomyces sp. DSM 45892]SFX47898.1 crossover junction endodeoxyribonuclease RuvC [Thermoactinomyces sp. DSM 45891]
MVEVKQGRAKLAQAFRVKTNPKLSHGDRLNNITEQLEALIKNEGPFDVVARERGFVRFAGATQAIYKVVGCSDLILRNYEIVEYSPMTIKSILTSNSRASKQEVELSVRRILKLKDTYQFESDDASDAVAVILTHLLKEKIIGRN